MKTIDNFKKRIDELTKVELLASGLIILIVGGVLLLNAYAPKISTIIFFIALFILLFLLWLKAGKTVFDSLVEVSGTAGVIISVTIFLTKSYCELPIEAQTATESLKSLYTFGLIYGTYIFGKSLYHKTKNEIGIFREANRESNPRLILFLYVLLVLLFLWQLYAVLNPIIHNLCIF